MHIDVNGDQVLCSKQIVHLDQEKSIFWLNGGYQWEKEMKNSGPANFTHYAIEDIETNKWVLGLPKQPGYCLYKEIKEIKGNNYLRNHEFSQIYQDLEVTKSEDENDQLESEDKNETAL